MKRGVLTLAAFLVAVPVFAQTNPIKVFVAADTSGDLTREVVDKISGRIGGMSRYALTNVVDADILLAIHCLPNSVGGRTVGVTCSSSIDYWPMPFPLSTSIPGMISAGDASSVAEDLTDGFVQNTSDAKVREVASTFKRRLNVLIKNYPNGVD